MTRLQVWLSAAVVLSLAATPGLYLSFSQQSGQSQQPANSADEGVATKAARREYLLRKLVDPATGELPPDYHALSLIHAKTIPERSAKRSTGSWRQGGPSDIGGRIRAFAIDVTDPEVILAGGVSGGIWKSTDRGMTWQKKGGEDDGIFISTIAQDPRPGSQHIWYYGTGENFLGRRGRGIYRSEDSGESWTLLTTRNQRRFASDSIRLVVHPDSGDLFLATAGLGIFRSEDGGINWESILGSSTRTQWGDSDIAINSDGNLIAVLGNVSSQTPPLAGFHVSTNEGENWTDITPTSFNRSALRRMVVASAPSNPNVAYAFADLTDTNQTDRTGLYRLDLSSNSVLDRSSSVNPPTENDPDYLRMQGGYNMFITVKPDDENFVVIGGTNIIRSLDGFASSVAIDDWIGGYQSTGGYGAFHHPDQHLLTFDPTNPDAAYSLNDGGIYYTVDITAPVDRVGQIEWLDLNRTFLTTQFYHTAISQTAGDPVLMGGTQDNGSPYLQFFGDRPGRSVDVSFGDGAYSYVFRDSNTVLTSSQFGAISWVRYEDTTTAQFASINAPDSDNFMFIHPFTVDPVTENVVFVPRNDSVWRHNDLQNLVESGGSPSISAEFGWEEMAAGNGAPSVDVTALAVSHGPNNYLYYGVTNGGRPDVFRVQNANQAVDSGINVSPPLDPGSFVTDIAVNPENENELIVVSSNLNIVGVYHSQDGGASWSPVEGNLEGVNFSSPGPSIRSALIMPVEGSTGYFLGTSTGLYFTENLQGSETQWVREAGSVIGNARIESLTGRVSDGRIVAASHGNGFFVRDLNLNGTAFDPAATQSGLYFDRDRNGHGFALRQFQNDVWGLFVYTYDDSGMPEWYLGTGNSIDGTFVTGVDGLPKFTYQEGASPPQQLDPQPFNQARIDATPSGQIRDCLSFSNPRPQNDRYISTTLAIGYQSNRWCSQPVVLSDAVGESLSGVWHNPNDTGWGLTIDQRGQTAVVVLYYYDGENTGVWALGSTDQLVSGAVIQMNEFRGYCRTCDATELTTLPAGTISLTYDASDFASITATVDVTSQGSASRRWLKENVTLAQLAVAE